MCEKALEIQEVAPLEFGNWYAYLRPKENELWGMHNRQWYLEHTESIVVGLVGEDWDGEPSHSFLDSIEHAWLPRQDQLQEMIDWNQWQLTARYSEFVHNQAGQENPESYFTSMEQLWLAFVMKEKYDKVWDGDNWK